MAIRRRLFMPPVCYDGGTGFLTLERPCPKKERREKRGRKDVAKGTGLGSIVREFSTETNFMRRCL
jgi:hypothetical protein